MQPLSTGAGRGLPGPDTTNTPPHCLDRANGIRLQIMELCETGADGRRNTKPIDGQEEWLPADLIITAIGQAVPHHGLETLEKSGIAIKADTNTFQTSQPGVFAIGDVTGQSAYAIEAIGHGRKVASVVHDFLDRNTTQSLPWETLPSILIKDEKAPTDFAHIPKALRENGIKKEAPVGFDEVHQSLTSAQAANEASRCLSCGCGDYHECKLISLANEYNIDPNKYTGAKKPKLPIDASNPKFVSDPNKCVLCGLCVRACSEDRAILTMAHRGFETVVASHPQSSCAQCGNCAAVCPVGARVATSCVE